MFDDKIINTVTGQVSNGNTINTLDVRFEFNCPIRQRGYTDFQLDLTQYILFMIKSGGL